ncbi:hypothetical protein EW146_g8920, partial [Bondarzewia mesenterica]
VDWQAGDALRPETYAHLLPGASAVVHTIGTLLEDTEYKAVLRFRNLGGAIRSFRRSSSGVGRNPLEKDKTKGSYEILNRDAALRVAQAFVESEATTELPGPRPFVYLSAEDIFRPMIPARYIETKRQAENEIELLVVDRPAYRGVYIRPSLVYHPHVRPYTSPVAAFLDLSSVIHFKLPPGLPSPSSILRSLSPAFPTGTSPSSPIQSSPLDSVANALTLPPIHVNHVAEAICIAADNARSDMRGVLRERRVDAQAVVSPRRPLIRPGQAQGIRELGSQTVDDGHDGKSLRMIMFGKPGAGKGTLSGRLVNKYDILSLSTGDLLRQHIAEKTEVGLLAEDVVAKGGLLPDEIMLRVITSKLDYLHNKVYYSFSPSHLHLHWILDGFPRTLGQGKLLDTHLRTQNTPLTLVINLDVPDQVILSRITDRWVHLPSGRVYNMSYNRPMIDGFDDETGEPLTKRPDDNPETFARRLKQFYTSTSPLLSYYDSQQTSTSPLTKLVALSGETSDEIWPLLERTVLAAVPSLRERVATREERRRTSLSEAILARKDESTLSEDAAGRRER